MLLLVNSALQTRHLIGQKAANFYLNCYTIIKVAEWLPVYVLWTLQLVKQSLAGCDFQSILMPGFQIILFRW